MLRNLVLLILLGLGPLCYGGPEDVLSEDAPVETRPLVMLKIPSGSNQAVETAKYTIQKLKMLAAEKKLKPRDIQVFTHTFGEETPDEILYVARCLSGAGFDVQKPDTIRREDVFPKKLDRINRVQQEALLFAEFKKETEIPKDVEALVTPELANGFLTRLNDRAKYYMGLGEKEGLGSLVTVYLNNRTGLARPSREHVRSLVQGVFFMALTAGAAYLQVNKVLGADPHVSILWGVVTASAFRFFFTYFKDAGNARHALSKFYSHSRGTIRPSFWWSLASQIFDSVTSSFVFQAAVYRGFGKIPAEIAHMTLATSIAGSFAKTPIMHFLDKKRTLLDHDNREAVRLLEEWRPLLESVPDEHFTRASDSKEALRDLHGSASEAAEKRQYRELHRYLESMDKILSEELLGESSDLTDVRDHFNHAKEVARNARALNSKLFWWNAGIDFFFDVVKYGSLSGSASMFTTYLTFGGIGMMVALTKSCFARTEVDGIRDLLDLLHSRRISLDTKEGVDRYLGALRNIRSFWKHTGKSFYSFFETLRLTKIGPVRAFVELTTRIVFGNGSEYEKLYDRAIIRFMREGVLVPTELIREWTVLKTRRNEARAKDSRPIELETSWLELVWRSSGEKDYPMQKEKYAFEVYREAFESAAAGTLQKPATKGDVIRMWTRPSRCVNNAMLLAG